jgi:hypothetical protein
VAVAASATGLQPQATTAHYPFGPSSVVSYRNDWDPVVQQPATPGGSCNTIEAGSGASLKDEPAIRAAAYKVNGAGLPLTTYVYQSPPSPFYCPAGVDMILQPGGDGTADSPTPVAVSLPCGTGADCPTGSTCSAAHVCTGGTLSATMLQGVPDVVAINSPVDITIKTIPPGFEHSSLQALLTFIYSDNLPQLDPTRSSLSGILSVSSDPAGNNQVDPNQPLTVGGTALRQVYVRLAFPNGMPDGFKAQLVAILRTVAATGAPSQTLIVSTVPLSHDHSPPTIGGAGTVRTQSGLTVNVNAFDPVSGIGAVHLNEGINGSSVGMAVMSHVTGNFFESTDWVHDFSSLQPTDSVSIDLSADDTHFNATPLVRLPVANTGGDRQVECTAPSGTPMAVLDGSRSTGPSDVNVSYVWSGAFGSASGVTVTEPLAFGANPVTLALTDGRGFVGSETSTLTVGDTTPPALTASVPESCLWPPNHKLVPYQLGTDIPFTVHDTCDANPTVKIVNVTSTDGEPPLFNATRLCLRSERAGQDHNGNVYTITLAATDAHGNTSTFDVHVTVPHSGGCAGPQPGFVSDSDPRCTF